MDYQSDKSDKSNQSNNPDQIKIFVDHVRHIYSCANTINTFGNDQVISNILHDIRDSYNNKIQVHDKSRITPDAVATNYGKFQGKKFNDNFIDRVNSADILICSELRRAMETAVMAGQNSKHKKVYVVPYVSETQKTVDNIPLENEKEYILKHAAEYGFDIKDNEKDDYTWNIRSNRIFSQKYMTDNYPSNKPGRTTS